MATAVNTYCNCLESNVHIYGVSDTLAGNRFWPIATAAEENSSCSATHASTHTHSPCTSATDGSCLETAVASTRRYKQLTAVPMPNDTIAAAQTEAACNSCQTPLAETLPHLHTTTGLYKGQSTRGHSWDCLGGLMHPLKELQKLANAVQKGPPCEPTHAHSVHTALNIARHP